MDRKCRGGLVRLTMLGCVVPVACVISGCGGTTGHATTGHTAAKASGAARHQVASTRRRPLPAPQGARAAKICRDGESAEDANVILSWANQGARSTTPTVLAALRTASVHVAREATEIHGMVGHAAAAGFLATAIGDESTVLNQTSRLVNLNTSQTRLLSALHTRITLARQLHVTSCAGVSPVSALRTTAPPPG